MTTLRLKTPPAKLPPLVAEATERAEAERTAREKAERQERHLRQTQREIEAGRRRRGEQRAADLALLRRSFPTVFADPPRPLLLRVSQAIRERLEDEISCLRLGAALHWWTSRDDAGAAAPARCGRGSTERAGAPDGAGHDPRSPGF